MKSSYGVNVITLRNVLVEVSPRFGELKNIGLALEKLNGHEIISAYNLRRKSLAFQIPTISEILKSANRINRSHLSSESLLVVLTRLSSETSTTFEVLPQQEWATSQYVNSTFHFNVHLKNMH